MDEKEKRSKSHDADSMAEKLKEKALSFEVPINEFSGRIETVTLGATKSEGGSRSHVIKVGGEKTMPFYRFEGENPHGPIIAMDVFDMKISLAKPVKEAFAEVLEDPAEWARLAVEKYGADMVTIHLISTDPSLKDTSAGDAANTVEDILQAVRVPIIVGGSGNPKKDPEVLEKAAEVSEGERVMLNSASLNTDFRRIGRAALKHGHVILSFTSMDINDQKTLNRHLFELGIKRDGMLMDPTTAPLGYGIEYSFSLMERMRLAGLKGDEDLQLPIASGTTNAWGAREAWMEAPEWGDRFFRGALWEAVSALALCLASADLLMMMNPASIRLFRETLSLLDSRKEPEVKTKDWIFAGD